MLKGVRCTGLLLVLVAVLLAGCSGKPETLPQPPDPSEAEKEDALAAVMGYMESRKAKDLKLAYRYLSQPAQALVSEADFVRHYSPNPAMEWKKVGPVTLVEKDWARVVVYDITVTREDGSKIGLPDFPYYVQRVGDRWGVALINPMLEKLDQAEGEKASELGGALLKVNPYSTNLLRRLYYGAAARGDADAAQDALLKLYMAGGPSDLADWQYLRADFWMKANMTEDALIALDRSLSLAEAYPDRYGDLWRSDVLVSKARAQIALDQLVQASDAVKEALRLNPENQEAQQLVLELARRRL